jgi:two-component system response regulator AtoC
MASQPPVFNTELSGEQPIPDHIVFGRSEAMRGVQRTIERLAGMRVPVLIEGQSGTGKEVIARKIHECSPGLSRSFVKLSCPAIPGGLVESELFGYEKGAFTGAWQSKPGRVEQAHLGTLFLDEISEMELSLQAKLLHLLQDGQFSRIGSQTDRKVDVLLISATNRDLEKEVSKGTFRADLYYRINVVNVQLPRLRDRTEDIPDLVEYFFNVYSRRFDRTPRSFSADEVRAICEYDWPGNIRELENHVKRYVILAGEGSFPEELLNKMELPRSIDRSPEDGLSLGAYTKQVLREVERNRILKVLQEHHWNRRRTAEALQISYRSLLYKIKRANLPRVRGQNSLRGHATNAVSRCAAAVNLSIPSKVL